VKTERAIEVIKQYIDFRNGALKMPDNVELDKALSKAVELMENANKITPFKCSETKEPLFIGDYVEDNEKRCGTLQFDTYINGYVIKTKDGGNIKAKHFTKIKELYNYSIVNANVECRSNNKRKW
jgi:beta-glucosidase-like glycosyl hydrolase